METKTEENERTKPIGVYVFADQKKRILKLSKIKHKKMSVMFWDLMEKELIKNKL